jgi:type II secretory pathway pseudopilin PulG
LQRKGGFLMRRRGFGIITAIILLVLIATIATMILSLTVTSSKKATDDYLRIQAEMLARSATEFAIMRAQGFDRSGGNCLENVNITAVPFDVNVTINYLGTLPAGCNNVFDTTVTDPDLNGMLVLDVVVSTQDGITTEPIRIHKRTLQKP